MDHRAFERLYSRLYKNLLHFFERRKFSPAESEDLTQEVFTKAWRGSDQLQDEEKSRSWLFAIAVNVLRSELTFRAALRRGGTDLLNKVEASLDHAKTLADPAPGPSESTEARQLIEELKVAIRQLPDQQRRVLVLHVYRDLPSQEIGRILNLKPETVRSHLHDARKRLKELFSR